MEPVVKGKETGWLKEEEEEEEGGASQPAVVT